MARQVAQRVVVASSECLVDPIPLPVRELIEHRAQVGHLVVVLDRRALIQIAATILAIGTRHCGLAVHAGGGLVG